MTDLYLGKYPPPDFPVPSTGPAGIGVEPFSMYPPAFHNGVICNDGVFAMLDCGDMLAVRKTRLFWDVRNAQESAMEAPFVDIARAKFHG